MRENKRTLYCIVANPAMASVAVPDMGTYSPKELAAKEQVSTTAVYTWIKDGLPVMRRGTMGNILINYQDYIQWMIDCARASEPATRDIPPWAFRFVRAASPRKLTKGAESSQDATCVVEKTSAPTDMPPEHKKARERAETRNNATGGLQMDFLSVMGVLA